jgi:hypothetical protein
LGEGVDSGRLKGEPAGASLLLQELQTPAREVAENETRNKKSKSECMIFIVLHSFWDEILVRNECTGTKT